MKVKTCWDDQETMAAGPIWRPDAAGAADTWDSALASDLPGPEGAGSRSPGGLFDSSPASSMVSAAGPAPTSLRRRASDSIFQSLMRLWPREGRRPEASIQTMARLRSAFRGCLADLMQEARAQSDVRGQLRLEAVFGHIVHSSHPEDLWHLRASIYTEVARARSQAEAERRVALLTLQFDLSRGRLKVLNGRG